MRNATFFSKTRGKIGKWYLLLTTRRREVSVSQRKIHQNMEMGDPSWKFGHFDPRLRTRLTKLHFNSLLIPRYTHIYVFVDSCPKSRFIFIFWSFPCPNFTTCAVWQFREARNKNREWNHAPAKLFKTCSVHNKSIPIKLKLNTGRFGRPPHFMMGTIAIWLFSCHTLRPFTTPFVLGCRIMMLLLIEYDQLTCRNRLTPFQNEMIVRALF